MISAFLKGFDQSTQELVRGAAIALVLKVLAAGAVFFLNVILARMLGADGSGLFFLSYTIVLIGATAGCIGMESALVKFVAGNESSGCHGKVLGVYRKAMLYVLISSSVLSLALYIVSPWLSAVLFGKPELAALLPIMLVALVPLSLYTLHAYALQGLKKIAASISVLSLIAPSIICALSLILFPFYGIEGTGYAYLIAAYVTLLVGVWFWRKYTTKFKSEMVVFDSKELLTSSLPMYGGVVMGILITWTPMLFLGVWESSENIGIYSAASRTAMLTSFVLMAVNSIAAPKFAALHKQNNLQEIGEVAQNSTKLMVYLSAPVLMLFIFFPEWVLSIFGDEFRSGAFVLVILAIGQFVNVATGSVGYLLLMTGRERSMRNNLMFCAFLAVIMNWLLIPAYGVIGGAIATAVILASQNIIATIIVWRKMGIIVLPRLK